MSPALALRLWRIAALVVTGLVLVALLLPGDRLPVAALAGLDELVHLGAYTLLGLSWHRAGLPVRWVLVLGVAMAVGTEVAQDAMGWGREGDPRDLAANVAGLVLGAGASALVGRKGGEPAGS